MSIVNKAFEIIKSHKLASIISLVLVVGILSFGAFTYSNSRMNANSIQANQASDDIDKKNQITDLENNVDKLSELNITKDAIDNSEPLSKTTGKCAGDSFYSENDGKLSVATRLSNGSWECVTFDIKGLQDYTSEDGKTSVHVESDTSGKKTVITKSTDDTGSTTTTTQVTNPDGSGHTSTEGGYGKMVIGPTNDGRQIYGYFDYSDNRYYTDVGRFQSCYLTSNYYTYGGRQYSDGTYREMTASEKTQAASEYDCSRLPKVQYENSSANLNVLKTCLREMTNSENFDTATCYRKAG